MEAEEEQQDPFETILSLSEQLLARDPDDVRVLAARAMSLHMLERYPEALAAYDRVLELQADDPVTHFARADILCKLRRYPEAIPAAEAAIRLGGERPEFLLARAEALIMELTADETGLSTVGRHPFADKVADQLSKVRQLIMLGPWSASEEASEIRAPQITEMPASAKLRAMSREELQATLDTDAGTILAAAEEVLAHLPCHAASYVTKAGALIKLGRTEEALAAGWQAVLISPDDPTIHYGHGLVADDAADPPRAVGAYMCAIALSDRDESPYNKAASQLNMSGLPTSTIWLLTGPLRPAKMSAQLFFDLGQAYLLNTQFERALEAFDQAEALEPLLHVALARAALLRLIGRTKEMQEALGAAHARQFAVTADKLGASARLRLAAQALVFLEDMPAADRLQFAAEVGAEIEDVIAAHAASGDLKGAITLLESAKFSVIRRERDRILPMDAIAEALMQIEKAPRGEALIYLVSGTEQAGAIMVTPAGWRWLSLPGLAEPEVRNARGALLQAYAACEGRRFIAGPQAQGQHSNDDFAQAVVICSRWLWTAGLGDLAEALIADGVERCSVVTSTRLGMFPLAAAQDENGHYFIERLVLSQETSAGHWIAARTAAAYGVRRYAIAIPITTGRDALPGARAEALDLARRLPEPSTEVLDGGRATAAAFIRAFGEADLVYYAGHAQANLGNPLDAILNLDGEPLRLADLVTHEIATPPRIVVLSGCETGMLGPNTPAHEPVSFAELFALLGVPGILVH